MPIVIKGLTEHLSAVKGFGDAVERELKKELDTLGLSWVGDAKRDTPTITGNLEESMVFDGAVKEGNEWKVELTNNLEYAEHVEYGHRQFVYGRDTGKITKGRYMVTNSKKRAEEKLPKIVEDALKRAGENL